MACGRVVAKHDERPLQRQDHLLPPFRGSAEMLQPEMRPVLLFEVSRKTGDGFLLVTRHDDEAGVVG